MNKAPNFCLRADIRKDGIFMENQSKPKPNVFKRIKCWWKKLDQNDRDWLKILGIWTVDGAMIGSCITASVMAKKAKKAVETGVYSGYYLGQLHAYKEMAQNPYTQMDAGMKRLEQQGKATKF